MSKNDGRVVSNFIVQALQNLPITIYGKGDQTRSFCYVSDLIEAIIAFMATSDNAIGPINIGNDGEFTMLELAQKVIAISGSKSQLVFLPLPGDDPKRRCPDLSLAKKALKYSSTVSIDEGLKPTIDYFKTILTDSSSART